MARVSKEKQERIEQVVMDQGKRMEARARMRAIQFLALLLCGGGLLYLGVSGGSTWVAVGGGALVLYALAVRVYLRTPRYVMDELRQAIDKELKAMDAEGDAGAANAPDEEQPPGGDGK